MTSEQSVLMTMSHEVAALKRQLQATKQLVQSLDEHALAVNEALLRLSSQNSDLLAIISKLNSEHGVSIL